MRTLALFALVIAPACKKDEDGDADPGTPEPGEPSPLLDVEETERWELPGLVGEAYVVRTAGSIPYVYAEDRVDLARVTGFVVARDRYFMIDLIRRLSQGRAAELLGDAALGTDLESRGLGMARVTDNLLAQIQADPEWSAIMGAYAEGVNAYVAEVNNNRLPVPSEYATLGPLLGRPDPKEILTEFGLRDMAAMGATFIYELGFETGDVGRTDDFLRIADHHAGDPLEDLRTAGLYADVWSRVEPVHPVKSALDWTPSGSRRAPPQPAGAGHRVTVPDSSFDRLGAHLERMEARLGHDHDAGWGSNAWAVAGTHTADGRSLLAGDGHLPLSIPSLFYSIGMDTEHLGGGGLSQVGLVIPGLPTLAVGTNGKVAWSQTQLMGDITDWYREELQLDGAGKPTHSRFQGSWEPLVEVVESYEVADVPLLGSVGRTETWSRWQTFDGRMITEIEGATVSEPGPGVVNLLGTLVLPGDVDGDGVVSAISFDHTGLDEGNLILASDGFGQASDVAEFQEASKRLVAYSQNGGATDADGDIFYTGYQAVPCRGYLPRNPDGTWVDGANPSMLLDGTQYGGFTIPIGPDGKVDESQAADPYRCVVPFDEYPQSISPPQGYLQTANNDPGGLSLDGSLTNDPWYIGGPWLEGYRAKRIDDVLAAEAAAGTATIASMATLQGDHLSTVADHWLATFLQTFDDARASADPRVIDVYTRNEDRFLEVEQRLTAWLDAGTPARAGVETFYLTVEPGDLEHAVATTLWTHWAGQAVVKILNDERWSGVYHPTGDTGRTRTLTMMLEGRGPGNPLGLASYNPDTQESAFFDDRTTPDVVETSTEVLLLALEQALDTLTAPETAPGEGGFGTDDMSQWLWGLRHMAQFESLLGEFLDAGDEFGFIVELFSITPDVLPLADSMPQGDPRARLPWFPRHGDHLNVDAGNTGFGTTEFMYGSGPVFRMVIALGPDGAEGVNILPGGQSGLKESEYWADQAALWLGNDTLPMLTTVDAVIGAASHRETFTPADGR